MPLKKIHQKITWALNLTPEEFASYIYFRKQQIRTFIKNHTLIKNRKKNAQLLHSPKHLKSQLSRPIAEEARFFFDPTSPAHLKKLQPHTDQILADAQTILNHEFDLLGSGPTQLSTPLPWHQDFKSGKTWPTIPASQIPYEFNTGNDIKVPWELSRFQHLPTLGQAHTLENKPTHSIYAQEFVDQITDWITKNPVHFGVNWKCTMDVAIRACNWIYAWHYFKDAPEITPEFKTLFYNSINTHGKFIIRNLEKFPFTSNHYLSDIVGLVYIGIYFPEFKEAKKWREFGIQALEDEIKKQVYPDGANFEASISYHRLTTELFAYPALLCKLNQIELSTEFYNRLQKMFQFTFDYTKPNGLAPMIGDFDDGRLHILRDYSSWDRRDHSYHFDIFNQLFPATPLTLNKTTSANYPNTGIYIFRTPTIYLIADCGQNGQNRNGGHAHNDHLSFELNAHGEDFFLDTGSYIYTPDTIARNRFRSTKMHNTLCINDEEINPIDPKKYFYLEDSAKLKIHQTPSTENPTLSASHSGYNRLNPPITHTRTFNLNSENALAITDEVTATVAKNINKKTILEWNFHLHPNVTITKRSSTQLTLTHNQASITFTHPDNLNPEILPTEISFSYGKKQPSKKITFKKQTTNLNQKWEFKITT